jgi:hypothetical protein
MARIQLWNHGAKNADYRFTDRTILEFFNASGTGLFVHLYLGTYGQDGQPDKGVTEIQDVVFQENRDRRYSSEVYEIRGTYNVADSDFDLRQFGLFLTGDTIFIEVHYNEMLRLLGRKLMSGDVIELPHLRDDALLDEGKAINKFYTVEDASRATDGYGSSWLPHIWRIKVAPMTNSQEYADILDQANRDPFGLETGGTLGDLIGMLNADMATNEAIIDEAEVHVFARNFDTRQFYMCPGDEETNNPNSWIFSGDGTPPNGAVAIGSGDAYPDDVEPGTYFLRTDYLPNALFMRTGTGWKMMELDYRRGRWSAATRLLEDFFNNTESTTLEDGTVIKARQALSKTIKPSADF